MPTYQQIDPATQDLLNRLLDTPIIQLMFVALVLMMAYQLASIVFGYLKSRQDARKSIQDAETDARMMNRVMDLNEKANENNEKANENTAALTEAINNLSEVQRETRAIHQANRESILAQQEATNIMVINVQNLSNFVKLMDDNYSNVRAELEALTSEIRTLQDAVKNPEFPKQITDLVNGATQDILLKLDEILRRIPEPPPSPAADKTKPATTKPTDADAAKHDATASSSGEAAA